MIKRRKIGKNNACLALGPQFGLMDMAVVICKKHLILSPAKVGERCERVIKCDRTGRIALATVIRETPFTRGSEVDTLLTVEGRVLVANIGEMDEEIFPITTSILIKEYWKDCKTKAFVIDDKPCCA